MITCSMMPRAAPPYSLGQWGTSQPRAASLFWNCLTNRHSSSPATSSPPRQLSGSSCLKNSLSCWRQLSCSAVKRNSIATLRSSGPPSGRVHSNMRRRALWLCSGLGALVDEYPVEPHLNPVEVPLLDERGQHRPEEVLELAAQRLRSLLRRPEGRRCVQPLHRHPQVGVEAAAGVPGQQWRILLRAHLGDRQVAALGAAVV